MNLIYSVLQGNNLNVSLPLTPIVQPWRHAHAPSIPSIVQQVHGVEGRLPALRCHHQGLRPEPLSGQRQAVQLLCLAHIARLEGSRGRSWPTGYLQQKGEGDHGVGEGWPLQQLSILFHTFLPRFTSVNCSDVLFPLSASLQLQLLTGSWKLDTESPYFPLIALPPSAALPPSSCCR